MAKVIEITNPLTGQPQPAIQSDYTAQQIDNAVAAVQPLLPGGPGLPVNQGGTGANTPQMALSNLGGRPNRNLLPNWYWKGGGSQKGYGFFPINQRGATSVNKPSGYSILNDRWQCSPATIAEIVDDGITITADFQVSIPKNELEIGKTYTFSTVTTDNLLGEITFKLTNGISLNENIGFCALVVFYNSTSWVFRVYGLGKTHVAVKLEEGDKQTIAYQDSGGVWKLFETPNYGDMLERCQRYLRSFNAWTKFEADYIDSNRIMFSIPGDMRTDPVVSGFSLYTGVQLQSGFAFEAHRNGNNITVVASKTGHGLTSAWLGVADKAYLSAEL